MEPSQGGIVSSKLDITSAQNPRIKQAARLWDRKERDGSGLFLIEGYRELLRACEAGWKIESLYVCPELFLGSNENILIQRLVKKGTQSFNCSSSVFHKLSYRDRPDGLIGVAKQIHKSLSDLDSILSQRKSPFLVVAEAIEKPGNLGTILRSSDAVAIDALIVADPCTDIFNPNVVRASVGTLFTVPVIQTTGSEALEWLKSHGIAILAATPAAQDEFTQVNMNRPLAIAVGTEQLGLSETWMKQADLQVRIPMLGVADSLNVAMATTLMLYEALRQRTRE